MPSTLSCGQRRRISSAVSASIGTPSRVSIACVARSEGVHSGESSRRPASTMSGQPNSASRLRHAAKARCAMRA